VNHWAGRIPTGEYEFFIDSQDRTIASWIGIDRNWFYWDAADYTARDRITWMANSSIERATCSWLRPPKLNMPTKQSGRTVSIIALIANLDCEQKPPAIYSLLDTSKRSL
jgi:hypothetical protein